MLTLSAQAAVVSDGEGFRIGKLDNGLTYYLYHNEMPKGCADFFIAHNVGALQEDDSQNGLAHFLEHMAFNGTAHYPDKALLDFLAKEGVRFGYNVNAYTNRTETVYNISKVPLVRKSFADSVLLVLRDWSCDISCEQEALDAERGVIHEEWRNRDGQRYRMATRQTALLYKGGKHPERTVLGDMNIILNFPREAILDFYHRWYRPDLQAIIVIGDIDVNDMEARIKAMFSDIPAAVNPEQKGNYAPPAQGCPIYENMTDPQLRYTALKVFCKQKYPGYPHNTLEYFRDQLSRQIVTTVIGEHLERECQKKDSPAKSSVAVMSEEQPYFYMVQFTATPKDKASMAECLAMTCREMERMSRHGISEAEFEQARVSVMKRSRLGAGEPTVVPDNSQIAMSCVENFLRGLPCVTPEELRTIRREALESLEYKDVAPYAKSMFSDCETIYSNCFNDNDAALMPSEAQMRAVVDSIRTADIPADYITYAKASLDISPAPGSIVRTIRRDDVPYECWKLSNGAKVWWVRSDSVKIGNHLSLELRFDTGLNAFSDDEVAAARFATALLSRQCGFLGQDRNALVNGPLMSGITYYTNTVKGRYASLSVSASGKRLEDAFRLTYLKLTDPYPCQESNLERARLDALQALAKDRIGSDVFETDTDRLRFGNHPWLAQRDSAAVQMVDMDYLRDVLVRLYGDPSKLEVFICSDAPREQIRTLVMMYLASLPCQAKSEARLRNKMLVPSYTGRVGHSMSVPRRTSPYTEIDCRWLQTVKDSPRIMACSDILDYIMSARYLAQIREARGGTYHVSFYTDAYRNGKKSTFESVVKFRTREELRDVLLQDVHDLMDQMCADGPSAEEMAMAVKYLVKRDAEIKEKRRGSVAAQNDRMMDFVRHGDKDYDYAALVRSITPEEVRSLALSTRSGARFEAIYEEL